MIETGGTNNKPVAVCDLCPRGCRIAAGGVGACRARGAVLHPCTEELNVVSLNYGKLAAIALDPIEKKPLYHFHPGSRILSVGSFGCNLSCPWCQNHRISSAGAGDVQTSNVTPEELVRLAEEYTGQAGGVQANNAPEEAARSAEKNARPAEAGHIQTINAPPRNIGVAFTYNEPLTSIEYVRDTSKLLKDRGLKSVLVTNGCANPARFDGLLPLIDAMNIDLKSINPEFYRKIGGDLDTILHNIRSAAARCHVELTCLLINGENDTTEEMERMVDFITSVSPDIPFHISRFFPCYLMQDRPQTSIDSMRRFEEIARRRLKHVHLGNIR